MEIGLEKMALPLQLKNKVFITFDIDWAPDFMVNHLIDLCLLHKVSATFFATHFSETLSRLRDYPDLFEIGLHPNFLPGSTQGDRPEEVFRYCKELVPDAVSIRTHSVYQYGRLYDLFNQHFGETIVDSSICMPGIDNIEPFRLYTPSGCLVRAPFFWADDYYLLGKHVLNPMDLLQVEGCKVYMFHPVHISQNTQNIKQYEKRKSNRFAKDELDIEGSQGMGALFKLFIEKVGLSFKTGLMKEFLGFEGV